MSETRNDKTPPPTLIVITGPTASGKSEVAMAVAEQFNGEIIGADSRQFYKEINIGTAKPSIADMQRVPHHFIDFLNLDEYYSAGRYGREVEHFLSEYFKRKSVAVMVGGSGLYINAVLYGFDELPRTAPEIRAKWDAIRAEQGFEHLQEVLAEKDPIYYHSIDKQNTRRVQRALEAIDASGKPLSDLQLGKTRTLPWNIVPIVLLPDRAALYERINQRVDQMMAAGLLDEAKNVYAKRDLPALNTVGYKELFEHFDESCSLDFAVDKIKQHTRNFAKRQYTWFRKYDEFAQFEKIDLPIIQKHLNDQVYV